MSRVKLFTGVILGVLAFSAVASSMAEAGWMVNGANFTSGTKALANTALVDQTFIFTAANAEVQCTSTTLKGKSPTINGATEMGEAESLEFAECTGNGVCPLAARPPVSAPPSSDPLTSDPSRPRRAGGAVPPASATRADPASSPSSRQVSSRSSA